MENLIKKYLEKTDYNTLSSNDPFYFIKDIGASKIKQFLKDTDIQKLQEKLNNSVSEDNLLKKIKSYKREYTKRMNLNSFIEIKAVELVFHPEEIISTEEFFDWIYSLRLNNEEEKMIDKAIYFYEDIKLYRLVYDGTCEDEINNEREKINKKLDELIYSKIRYQRKMDLIKWIMERNEQEIDIITNSGPFDTIMTGYCLLALEEAGIKSTSINFNRFFNEKTAADAREKGKGRI